MQYTTLFRCTDMDVLCGDSCKEGKRCSSSFSRYWLRNSFFIKQFTFKIMGAIRSTKIQTGPTGKRGPPQKVDQFFRNFSGWTEPIHWVFDRNFREFWLNGSRPIFTLTSQQKSSALYLSPSWSWRKRPKRIRSEQRVKWSVSDKYFITFFFRSVYEARERLHNSATHENPRYWFRTSFTNSELSLRNKRSLLYEFYMFFIMRVCIFVLNWSVLGCRSNTKWLSCLEC